MYGMSVVDVGGGKRGPGERDGYDDEDMPDAKAVAAEGAAKQSIQHQFSAACNSGNYAEADRILRIYGGQYVSDVFEPWYTGGVRAANLATDVNTLRVLQVLLHHGLLLTPAEGAIVRERMRQADQYMVLRASMGHVDGQALAQFRSACHGVLTKLEAN